MLRAQKFIIGSPQEFDLGFINLGSGPGAESWLSIDALPREAIPSVRIEWPTPAGEPVLRTSHQLTERCCYWDFYTKGFKHPAGIAAGKAKVSITLPTAGKPLLLTTTVLEVPVVPALNE
jgi:hypothetical protein